MFTLACELRYWDLKMGKGGGKEKHQPNKVGQSVTQWVKTGYVSNFL